MIAIIQILKISCYLGNFDTNYIYFQKYNIYFKNSNNFFVKKIFYL